MGLDLDTIRFDDAGGLDESTASDVVRLDFGELASPVETPAGFLLCQGIVARVGVQEYVEANGKTIREFRPPEEVFDPESMRTFAISPLTNDHPPGLTLINPENIRQYQTGTAANLTRVDNSLRADILITDKQAIADARAGKTGLSSGYRSRVYAKPGVWKSPSGEEIRFDTVQTRIRGNHIAQCWKSRAGDGARIRMDSLDAVAVGHPPITTGAKKMATKKIKVGDTEHEVEDTPGVNAIITRMDALEAAAAKASKPADNETALRAELDRVRGELDAANSELATRKDSEVKFSKKQSEDAAFKTRLDLLSRAQPILDKPIDDLIRMDSIDIMREVIATQDAGIDLSGKSEDYVAGIFNHVTKTRVDSSVVLGNAINKTKDNAKPPQGSEIEELRKKREAARVGMHDNMQNGWKTA